MYGTTHVHGVIVESGQFNNPCNGREYAWLAYYEGEPDAELGYGSTSIEAVHDLTSNYDNPHEPSWLPEDM